MVISLKEINPLEGLNEPSRAKNRTNDVLSKHPFTKDGLIS